MFRSLPIDPSRLKIRWRAARGVYALEDTFLAELMEQAGMLDG